jgi:hypothetical protein
MYKGSAGTGLQPEVLFKYPPGKRLALKDLPGFCFPNGVQARVMERTPSMSELNEVRTSVLFRVMCGYLYADVSSMCFSYADVLSMCLG